MIDSLLCAFLGLFEHVPGTAVNVLHPADLGDRARRDVPGLDEAPGDVEGCGLIGIILAAEHQQLVVPTNHLDLVPGGGGYAVTVGVVAPAAFCVQARALLLACGLRQAMPARIVELGLRRASAAIAIVVDEGLGRVDQLGQGGSRLLGGRHRAQTQIGSRSFPVIARDFDDQPAQRATATAAARLSAVFDAATTAALGAPAVAHRNQNYLK